MLIQGSITIFYVSEGTIYYRPIVTKLQTIVANACTIPYTNVSINSSSEPRNRPTHTWFSYKVSELRNDHNQALFIASVYYIPDMNVLFSVPHVMYDEITVTRRYPPSVIAWMVDCLFRGMG
jgi:hypothetical protein